MTANPSKITDEFDELFGEFQSATKLPEENTNKDINDEDEEQNINIYFGEKHISKNIIQVQDENNHDNLVNKILSKNEFINTKIEELKKQNPKLTDKQLYTRAKLMWKNKK